MPSSKAKSKAKTKGVYKRNFLAQVIIRFDFDQTNLDFLTDFSKEIKAAFPLEQQLEKAVAFMINVPAGNVQQSKNTFWTFLSANKSKKLEISANSVTLQYFKYKDSKELFDDTEKVLIRFLILSKIETINRIGLRYINEIDLENIKKNFSWDNYFNNDLLAGIHFAVNKTIKLARYMGQLIFKQEEADIKFGYGIYNKDFPNEITRKQFVLDYDCYSRLPVGASQDKLKDCITKYNSYIQDLFESSITDKFRKLLNK